MGVGHSASYASLACDASTLSRFPSPTPAVGAPIGCPFAARTAALRDCLGRALTFAYLGPWLVC